MSLTGTYLINSDCSSFDKYKIPLIGITGGIGSGKSTAAGIFEKLGAVVLNADDAGREVIDKYPSIIKRLTEEFGCEITNKNGSLNRKKLALTAFKTPDNTLRLNNILHPLMITYLKKQIVSHKKKGCNMIMVDAALIFEAETEACFDKIICVEADESLRLLRTSFSDKDFKNRKKVQISELEKRERADIIIKNNSTFEDLENSCKIVYLRIIRDYP